MRVFDQVFQAKRGSLSVRIISGSAKGRKLRQFKGQHIRPTADRVREAIFSSLLSRLGSFENLTVLDLFAGTGALSLEALSRGASRAVLVDPSAQSAEIITENIQTCRMDDRATLFKMPASNFIAKPAPSGPFDLIFLDPPYNKNLIVPTLHKIVQNGILAKEGLICIESAREDSIPDDLPGLMLLSRREYGSTAVSFYSLSTSMEDHL
ncbi:MAG: 16S rRNA (guanine(966)-N(2))-methyltransferase RsmD [Pedobacter sp.]